MSVVDHIKKGFQRWLYGKKLYDKKDDDGYVRVGQGRRRTNTSMNDVNRAALMGEISIDKAARIMDERYQKVFDAMKKK